MKKIYTFYSIFVFFIAGFSQGNIDSLVNRDKQLDKTSEHLIYEYRLPDWGYKQSYLNFANDLGGQTTKRHDESDYDSYTNIYFAPYYNLYFESEKNIYSFNGFIATYFNHSVSDDKNNATQSKSILNQLRIDLNLDAALSHYFTDNWYLSGQTDNRLYFTESHDNDSYKTNGTSYSSRDIYIYRNFDLSGKIGLGYGRVRNVTPVFRALRFNERLRDLNIKTEGARDLAELADFFAKRSAYSSTYDRSAKYFYNDLPENTIKILQNAQPWEIIYLDETWNEIVGNRYEGTDINGGITFNYEKRENSDVYNELFLLGLYIEQRYYHNFCSSYQFGTHFYSSFSNAVNNNTPYNYFGKGQLQIENLWNMTDKMLAQLNLGVESAFSSEDRWQRRDRYFSEISFQYFIENNVSVNFNAFYNMYQNWPIQLSFDYENKHYNSNNYKEQNIWSLRFSLTYFLERGLL